MMGADGFIVTQQPANDLTQVELIDRLNVGVPPNNEIVNFADAVTRIELKSRSPSAISAMQLVRS